MPVLQQASPLCAASLFLLLECALRLASLRQYQQHRSARELHYKILQRVQILGESATKLNIVVDRILMLACKLQAEDRAKAPTRLASGLLAAVAAAQLSLTGMHDVPNCDSSAAYTSCGPLNKLLVSAGAANALPGNYSGTPQIVSPGDAKAERDGKVHLASDSTCQSKVKHCTQLCILKPDLILPTLSSSSNFASLQCAAIQPLPSTVAPCYATGSRPQLQVRSAGQAVCWCPGS